jgi:anti-sigma factor RsiW
MQTDLKELTCKDLVELVTDYFEGALSSADRERFEQHIAKCDWCKIYLEQMQATIRTLGSLPEETINQRAKEELLSVFRDWKKSAD